MYFRRMSIIKITMVMLMITTTTIFDSLAQEDWDELSSKYCSKYELCQAIEQLCGPEYNPLSKSTSLESEYLL